MRSTIKVVHDTEHDVCHLICQSIIMARYTLWCFLSIIALAASASVSGKLKFASAESSEEVSDELTNLNKEQPKKQPKSAALKWHHVWKEIENHLPEIAAKVIPLLPLKALEEPKKADFKWDEFWKVAEEAPGFAKDVSKIFDKLQAQPEGPQKENLIWEDILNRITPFIPTVADAAAAAARFLPLKSLNLEDLNSPNGFENFLDELMPFVTKNWDRFLQMLEHIPENIARALDRIFPQVKNNIAKFTANPDVELLDDSAKVGPKKGDLTFGVALRKLFELSFNATLGNYTAAPREKRSAESAALKLHDIWKAIEGAGKVFEGVNDYENSHQSGDLKEAPRSRREVGKEGLQYYYIWKAIEDAAEALVNFQPSAKLEDASNLNSSDTNNQSIGANATESSGAGGRPTRPPPTSSTPGSGGGRPTRPPPTSSTPGSGGGRPTRPPPTSSTPGSGGGRPTRPPPGGSGSGGERPPRPPPNGGPGQGGRPPKPPPNGGPGQGGRPPRPPPGGRPLPFFEFFDF